jgi:DNA-binding GntR family transcriptional regulator
MEKLYETVSNTFPDWMLYEYMFRHPELLQSSLIMEFQEHQAIADAIARRDGELAVKCTLAHIYNLGREFENFLGISGRVLREKESQILPQSH